MKQLTFRKLNKSPQIFGGALLKSGTHPKTARPLDSRMPTHLVLRAERSVMRLPKYFTRVDELTHAIARAHGVRIYEYANAGNHLHILLKIPRRAAWSGVIRDLTGRIRHLTAVRWAHRPFTRVVPGWRKAFWVVKDYVQMNSWEADHDLSKAGAAALRKLRKTFDFAKYEFVYA